MPTITLNKEVFEELVGKELPLDELKDRISMLGTDLESVEGNEIQVEIFPNRPDMLSEQGFARAFSSFIGEKVGLRSYDVKESGYQLFVKNTPEYWPYALAFIAKNLELNEEKLRELIQLQEKLGVTMLRNRKKGGIGIYPLEKLKFPITFEGKDWKDVKFRPLEYPVELSVKDILEKHKKGKEYGHLMKDWDKCTLFIDNDGTIMSMPPIINSHDVGKVEETTTDLFIECTGTDLQTLTYALNIFAASLSDMGASIESIEVHLNDKVINCPNLAPTKKQLDLNYVNKRLGLKLNEEEVKTLLEKMGFGYENGEVLIPAYRADILHQVDFIEDIAIAYGYENFVEEIPNVATIGEEDPFARFAGKVKESLIGLGLLEAKNYHLITKKELADNMRTSTNPIPLKNSLGEHNHLRDSLIPSLLKNLHENQHHEFPQNIFEVGRVFSLGDTETGVLERENLSVVLCHDKTDFTEIRQVLDVLFGSLGLEVSVKETEHKSYIFGRVARIIINEKEIGIIGELHPSVLDNWELVVPAVCLELDLEEVFRLLN